MISTIFKGICQVGNPWFGAVLLTVLGDDRSPILGLPWDKGMLLAIGLAGVTLISLVLLGWTVQQRRRFRAERATLIARSQVQIEVVLQNLRVGVLVVDRSLQIILTNQAALDLLQLSDAQLRGLEPLPLGWQVCYEDDRCQPSIQPILQDVADHPGARIVVGIQRCPHLPTWVLIDVMTPSSAGHLHGDQGARCSESLAPIRPYLGLPPGSLIFTFSDVTERKQSELRLLHRTKRKQQLHTLSQFIRRSLSPETILTHTVHKAREFFVAQHVVLAQVHLDGSLDRLAESSQGAAALSKSFNCPVLPQPLYQRLRQGHLVVGDGTARDVDFSWTGHHPDQSWESPMAVPAGLGNRYTPRVGEGVSTTAWFQVAARELTAAPLDVAIAPILQGDTLWGVLTVQLDPEQDGWQLAELELLEQLSTQVAIALQQAQFYNTVQKFNNRLESQVAERTRQIEEVLEFESILKRITDKVRDSLDEDQILQTAVRELGIALMASSCNTSVYDVRHEVATVCYEYSVSSVTYQGRVVQMSNRPEIYAQIRQGLDFQFCSLAADSPRGQAVMMVCPVMEGESVIGDLWVVNEAGQEFTISQVRFVKQVANQCAIALRQARLYQESQVQIEQLEKLNRLKDDFLSTVSHELRTPMSNMKMAIHMLKVSPDPDRRERYLQILESECTREVELINDLLDLQRLEGSSYQAKTDVIRLEDWLPAVVSPFQSRTRQDRQYLRVHCPSSLPALRSDEIALRRIVSELLNNACKYTPAGGAIILDFQTDLAAATPGQTDVTVKVTLEVRNQASIPVQELPHIFEKFYRVPNGDPWSRGGTGLGLALVKKLVEQMQGSIQVHSENHWTSFLVEFSTIAVLPPDADEVLT